ncbi:MAG: hypothetical protein GXP49_12870 [Deltaproteobacteria bacterium]|nr:hypothetical protein [Deltaproteobacteria bacterium]
MWNASKLKFSYFCFSIAFVNLSSPLSNAVIAGEMKPVPNYNLLSVTGDTGGLMSGETLKTQLAELGMVYLLRKETGKFEIQVLRTFMSIHGTFAVALGKKIGPLDFSRFLERITHVGSKQILDLKKKTLVEAPAASMIVLQGETSGKDLLKFASHNKLFTAEKYGESTMFVGRITVSGITWLVCSSTAVPDIPRDVNDWEARWAAYLSRGNTKLLSLPDNLGGGPRRVRAVQELENSSKMLLIDLGNALEGYSWVDFGQRNRQRPNSLELLKELGYSMVCPGSSDLAFGMAGYRAELAEAGVSPLNSNIVDQRGKFVFKTFARFKLNGIPVKFYCFSSKETLGMLPRKDRGKFKILNLTHALKKLDLDRKPGEVFIAGFGPGTRKLRDELRRLPQLFDIIMSPVHRLGPWLPGRIHEKLGTSFSYTRNYLFPGKYSIGVFSMGPEKDEEEWRVTFLNDRIEPDRKTLERMMAVRFEALKDEDRIILPDPTKVMPLGSDLLKELILGKKSIFDIYLGSGWENNVQDLHQLIARYLDGLLDNLVGNILVRLTAADACVLMPLEDNLDLPGSITAGMLASVLAVPDKLVIVELDGRNLIKILKKSGFHWAMADPVAKLVQGWPVDTRAGYRLVTTDVTAAELGLEAKAHTWNNNTSSLPASSEDDEVPLSGAVIQYLDKLKSGHEETAYLQEIQWLLKRHGKEKKSHWSFDLSALDLAAERTGIWKPGGFDKVTDSRVGVQDLTRMQVFLQAALARETENYLWKNTLKAQLGLSITTGWDDRIEDSDDLVLSSDFRYRIGANSWLPRPYVSFTYDSEILVKDNPRQQQVFGDIGAVLEPGKKLPELGLSTFVSHDFVTTGTSTRPGLGLFFKGRYIFGKLTISDAMKFRYYVPVGDETDDLLRLTLENRFSFSFLMVSGISIKLFANLFLFSGVINKSIGHSWNWGSALSYTWLDLF